MNNTHRQIEIPVHNNPITTSRPLDVNSPENSNISLPKEIQELEKLKKKLLEVKIRFDTNPHFYQKEDYKKLIDLLGSGLIHSYEESLKNRIITSWEEVIANDTIPSSQLVYNSLKLIEEYLNYLNANKQDTLEAGENITITGNVISASNPTWGNVQGDISLQSDLSEFINEEIGSFMFPEQDKEVISVLTYGTEPSSAEEDDYYINSSQNKLYKYVSDVWAEQSADIEAVYIAEDTAKVYVYQNNEFSEVAGGEVDGIIYIKSLQSTDNIDNLEYEGVYKVGMKYNNKSMTTYYTLIEKRKFATYQTLYNEYYIHNRTQDPFSHEWSDWETKEYAFKSDLDLKQDILTSGDNISIDATNTISAEGYTYDQSSGSFLTVPVSSGTDTYTNTCTGLNALCTGQNNSVSGEASAAIGGQDISIIGNVSANVGGYNNTLSASYSVICGGQENNIPNGANNSFITGRNNTASGFTSIAIGRYNDASNNYSIAIGSGSQNIHNIASGNTSIAIGFYNNASAEGAIAFGTGIEAKNVSEVGIGAWNVSHNGVTAMSLGSGASNSRKNSLEITTNGDIYIDGIGNYTGTTIAAQGNNIKTFQSVINGKQDQLTAGEGIQIDENNVISVTIPVVKAVILSQEDYDTLIENDEIDNYTLYIIRDDDSYE